ncbi:MAG: ArsR/SmtB family transcription factor [Anaerolineae bacterium]|jgi:ArsR family transcriptional regulator|nr:helix-turn-helix transcriptional regulator [Chloroflexota bacterium]
MLNQYDHPDLQQLAVVLRALSHPHRLAILRLLLRGRHCNCELAAALGLAINLISHHLRTLEQAGLVCGERAPQDARWIYYSVDVPAMQAARSALFTFLDPSGIAPRDPQCPR